LSGHQNAIFSIDISENNNRRLIGTGSLDKTIKIWSVSGKRFHSLIGHDAEVTKVEFNPNGQYLLSSSLDGLIKVWDLEKGRAIMDLRGQENGIVNFSHNYQGDQVICCGFSSVPMVAIESNIDI
jgi:WD40 repeat protein